MATMAQTSLAKVNSFSTATNSIHTAVSPASNPLTAKEEFDVTVSNIMHTNILLGITVDGLIKTQLIPGNPPFGLVPTSKTVVFQFDRHTNATAPTALPIKLGDEYDPCISFYNSTNNRFENHTKAVFQNNTNASCLRASINSLTQPQKTTLDSKYIP